MGIYGQDWASYQSTTPDTTGLSFVFLKVTEGLNYVNPKYVAQKQWAAKHGLVIGMYHYPHMHNNPDREAEFFIANAGIQDGNIVVLDWEGYDANNRNVSPSEQLAYKEEYLRFLKSKLPNNPVGLYCNVDYWTRIDKDSHAGDFLWIATANKPAGHPGITSKWVFHQYGASGVDKDYANFSDKNELVRWAYSFSVKPPIPPKTVIPTVHIDFIKKAATVDPKSAQGHKSFPTEVKIVEQALLSEKMLDKQYATDGSFGSKTVEAYAKWQKHLGYSGKAADGIPGKASLTALGKRHNFHVV